jgi:hypothetical protein
MFPIRADRGSAWPKRRSFMRAMPLRLRVSTSVRLSFAPLHLTAASITLVLTACSSAASVSTTPGQLASGLTASSSGVCQAIAALPDLAAAERDFTNLAHQALHELAADPRLARSMSARVLETMATVEDDFRQSPDVAVLTDDLKEVHASADAALTALGQDVPPCSA